MPLSQVSNLILLLSAICGGAVALIVAGIGLRTGAAGPGDAGSAARGELQAAMQRIQPVTQVALDLVFLAFLAAIPKHALRELLLIGAVAFLAIDALQASSGAFGLKPLVRSRSWLLVAVQAGALVMASLWGDRLAPVDGVGRVFPFGVAAAMVLATTFLGMLPGRFGLPGQLAAPVAGALAAWALSTQVLGASDLWQPVVAGCALSEAIAIVLALAARGQDEPPAPLAVGITLCAGGALMLIGREYGMYGVGVAAIGLLPLALSNLRLACLLPAIFAGRALLQWSLVAIVGSGGGAGRAEAGLDITRPYAVAALVAGLLLALVPSQIASHLRTRASLIATLAALVALPPLAAVVAGPAALAALVLGLLVGAVALPPATYRTVPVLLVYCGAIAALLTPRLADLGPLPAAWRLGALALAAGLVAVAIGLVDRGGAASSAAS